MLDYLGKLSVIDLFCLLSSVLISVSIITLFLVKRFIPLDLRYKDDSVIGNISSLISIIYGVLVGITALYLINNMSFVDDIVQKEAHAVANIFRDSNWLRSPDRENIQIEIKKYVQGVVNVEWPAMRQGKPVTHEGDLIIKNIVSVLKNYNGTSHSETLILPRMLDDIRTLDSARAQRIHLSMVSLSSEVWLVVIIGTILTIAINYLFGMHFYLHMISVSAVALMASAMLFLLISLDRPFQGEFVIQSDIFNEVLALVDYEIKHEPNKSSNNLKMNKLNPTGVH